MFKTVKLVLAATAVATLVACGGGGGGGTTVAPAAVTSTDTFQLKTAYVNYLNNSGSYPFTVTGTVNGYSVTGSGTSTTSSLTAGTFEGVVALVKTSTVTGSITANGTTASLASTGTGYVDSSYNQLGSNGTEYSVVSGAVSVPLTAKVNDTGIWYSTNRYTTSSKSVLLGTGVVSFVMEPDTASTAYLTIISTLKNTGGTTTTTQAQKFRITPAGQLTRIRETLLDSTSNITITY